MSIGRKAKLDFSRVTPETFEQRRLEYHHALQEEYFSAFEVIGTRTHTLRPGDSLWYLAERKYEVPVWLIRQFNPDLDFGALQAGTRMIIPEVGPRPSVGTVATFTSRARGGVTFTPPTRPGRWFRRGGGWR